MSTVRLLDIEEIEREVFTRWDITGGSRQSRTHRKRRPLGAPTTTCGDLLGPRAAANEGRYPFRP